MHSNGQDIVDCCGLLSCDSSKEESLDRLPGSLDKPFRMSEVTFAFLLYVKLNYITIVSSLQESSDNLDTWTCSAEGRRKSVIQLSDNGRRRTGLLAQVSSFP